MAAGDSDVPDWRDAAAYAPLLRAGRAAYAWEWLRRDAGYRAAAACALASRGPPDPARQEPGEALAARWGLHAFEPPERNALEARPLWRREIFPYVLQAAVADEADDDDRLDLGLFERLVTLVIEPSGTEHLLLSDGLHAIRVDIVSGTLRAGPAHLQYQLQGFRRVERPLLALRQLFALRRMGRFSPALHARERRAPRWILLLRAYDALVAGATQRDIADCIFGLDATERRWRVQASSLRSRVQRLVRQGRRMASGGYLSLLD